VDRMSIKKRDQCLSAAPISVNSPPESTVVLGQPMVINANANKGDKVHVLCYIPTGRYLKNNAQAYMASRTSTTPFLKGLSETWDIIPNNASLWRWRRIVVSSKQYLGLPGQFGTMSAESTQTSSSSRPMVDLSQGTSTGNWVAVYDVVQDFLFLGVKTTDWIDQMVAPVDKNRFTVHSDSLRTIGSGNDFARPKICKTWTPFNKTLRYDDEENGNSITTVSNSVQDKRGMGNVYVFDLFSCPTPVTASPNDSTLSLNVNSTLYWHEK